jgi:hypothetical protein
VERRVGLTRFDCRQVKEPERKTISRYSDEPKLEIGAIVSIKEGVVGVFLARYTPSGRPNEIRYIVELVPKS